MQFWQKILGEKKRKFEKIWTFKEKLEISRGKNWNFAKNLKIFEILKKIRNLDKIGHFVKNMEFPEKNGNLRGGIVNLETILKFGKKWKF